MTIYLNDIRIFAYHGVMHQESIVGDWYVINVKLNLNDESSTETDNLKDTVNYADVYEVIKAQMAIPSKLIEHVCGRICNCLLEKFQLINEVAINITKQNPPMGANCKGCGVELIRKR